VDRDLSSHDLWEESLARSRRRREAAATAKGFDLPARGLSVAALVAVTGGTVVSVGAASVIGGGDDDSSAGGGAGRGAGMRPAAAVAKASARGSATEGAASPGARSTGSSSSTSTSSPTSTADPGDAQGASFAADNPAAPEQTLEERALAVAKGVPVARVAAADAAPVDQAPAPAEDAEQPASEQPTDEPPVAEKPDGDGTDAPRDVAPPAPKHAGGVAELQQQLGVAPDGDFGPATERALKRWQRSHGLEADGIAGPATREALDIGDGKILKRDKPAPHRATPRSATDGDSQQHAAGGGVRELQRALGIGVDGVFGPGTEQALKQWQQAHGLAADGVAGPATREALGIGAGKVLKRRGGGGSGGSGSGSGGDGGSSTVARVVAAANRIATTPYVYGGGHGSFEASGYDCSGSVSYALHGGGLLDSPLDSSALMSYGAPGPGSHITIYANAGHAYMVVDGRRFDTSARSETGSRWSSTQRSSSGYVVRHPKGL
jgi:peptidoglycan hydrolase-like protein with peptidoglycan-binding domain